MSSDAMFSLALYITHAQHRSLWPRKSKTTTLRMTCDESAVQTVTARAQSLARSSTHPSTILDVRMMWLRYPPPAWVVSISTFAAVRLLFSCCPVLNHCILTFIYLSVPMCAGTLVMRRNLTACVESDNTSKQRCRRQTRSVLPVSRCWSVCWVMRSPWSIWIRCVWVGTLFCVCVVRVHLFHFCGLVCVVFFSSASSAHVFRVDVGCTCIQRDTRRSRCSPSRALC